MIVGCHVNKNGLGFGDAIKRDMNEAKENGILMKACQIFVMGPRNSHINVNDADIAAIKLLDNIKVFVHSSYLTNPWGNKAQFGIIAARKELELCDSIGSAGLIVHLAKKTPAEIAAGVVSILAPRVGSEGLMKFKSKLWLEIDSYKAQADVTYETPGSIRKLLEELKRVEIGLDRVGICIDTAHLWAAGVDVGDFDSGQNYMTKMCEIIEEFGGKCSECLMVHFNDQIHSLGSGRDEHMALGYGTIWNSYRERKALKESGLYAVVMTAAEKNIPLILERKSDVPKINGLPACSNVVSDYLVLGELMPRV